jgi:hypothetical protein
MKKTARKANLIAERIRDDYGTVTHFCRKHNINHNTFKSFINGYQRSLVLGDILKEMGYLLDDSEIPSNQNVYDNKKEQVA